jgi:phosphoribosyl-ATP pyrophosphohydrolase
MSTITLTLKMDKAKKEAVYAFCHEQGIMINKFFEKAAENEIERRLISESADIFKNYERHKKTAVDFDEVMKTLKSRTK